MSVGRLGILRSSRSDWWICRRDKGRRADEWGPCACPPWGSRKAARTSTRPSQPPHIAPCPYAGRQMVMKQEIQIIREQQDAQKSEPEQDTIHRVPTLRTPLFSDEALGAAFET